MSSALQKKCFRQAQIKDWHGFSPHQELSRLLTLGGELVLGRVVAWSSGSRSLSVLGFFTMLQEHVVISLYAFEKGKSSAGLP